MTKINIKFVIAVVAIVFAGVIISLGGLTVTKINNLNDEIGYLNSRIAQLDNDIDRNSHQISGLVNEIQKMLNEQSKNYFDEGYEIKSIDGNRTAVVDVYFSLKEAAVQADVEVTYRKGNKYDSVAAIRLSGGRFIAEIELSIDSEYEISYSITLDTVKTESLMSIRVYSSLRNRFQAQADLIMESKDRIVASIYVSNRHNHNEKLKMATAKVEIFKEDALIKTINMLDYAVSAGDGYEEYGHKMIELTELVSGSRYLKVDAKITIVDNFGMEYIFGPNIMIY